MLTIELPQSEIDRIHPGSHQLIPVLCSCGKRRQIERFRLTDGQQTCGRCSWKSKEFWLSQKWGNLRLDPNQEFKDEWGPGSGKKFHFLCDYNNCNKTYFTSFGNVACKGGSVTCGKCNDIPIKEILKKRWNNLRLDPNQKLPEFLSLKSNKEFWFLCD